MEAFVSLSAIRPWATALFVSTRHFVYTLPARGPAGRGEMPAKDRLYRTILPRTRERQTQIDEPEAHAHRLCRSRAAQSVLLGPRSPNTPSPPATDREQATRRQRKVRQILIQKWPQDTWTANGALRLILSPVCRPRVSLSDLLRLRSPLPAWPHRLPPLSPYDDGDIVLSFSSISLHG